MFRKNFKVKTSTTVKGSERRRLRSLLETQYPILTPDDINFLIPTKSEMNQVKAMTYSGSIVMIYCCGENPIFFQVEDRCYPTIYTLWKFPNLLPSVTTVPPVLEKIIGGADLMAPGVIADEGTIPELRNLERNNICSVRIYGNKCAIAIGIALLSESELCAEGVKGKAVSVVHNYKDHLWLSGNQLDLPLIVADEPVIIENDKTKISAVESNDNILVDTNVSDLKLDDDNDTANQHLDSDANNAVPDYDMDDILFKCFMVAIKTSGKKIALPILTSTFYGTHVLGCCPQSLTLDIKKSTFKKLSVFLKKMVKESVIQVKELTKGVESIVSINTECEMVKSFFIEPIFKSQLEANKVKKAVEEVSGDVQVNYKFPSVTELFVVSAQVKVLFEFSKIRKGDTVTGTKVREVLKMYVRENSLQNEKNPREVILDPILADCVLRKGENKTSMSWEDIYEAIVSKMPHAFEVSFADKNPIIKKGKLEPIHITVDTRTANKKVTLIQNLETYGINPEKLAQHVQVAVAASTSMSPTQNGKGTVVLIQGNQVRYLQKLLLDMYKIPRKYIRGLENVPAKKKPFQ